MVDFHKVGHLTHWLESLDGLWWVLVQDTVLVQDLHALHPLPEVHVYAPYPDLLMSEIPPFLFCALDQLAKPFAS